MFQRLMMNVFYFSANRINKAQYVSPTGKNIVFHVANAKGLIE